MKITVKTLQQKVFQIDAEGSDTVGDLKKKIQETQGHAAESQKLIYSGKVLPDSKTVESCEIKEKDFLVLMVSKPKPTPVAAPSTSAAPAAPPAAAASALAAEVPPSTPAAAAAPQPPNAPILTPAQPAPVEGAAPTPAAGDGSFLAGDALQSTINNMIEMGFERDQVMRALRASFNNPERAVEYLFNGIPAHLEHMAQAPAPAAQPPSAAAPAQPAAPAAAPVEAAQPDQPAQPAQPQNLFQLAQQRQQQAQQPGAGGGLPGLGAGGANLGSLADHPQVQHLRNVIAQNPQLAQPIIQELAAQNPGLAQLIGQNPEMLAQLLTSALEAEGEEGGQLPPGAQVVHVTEEERAAIERLEALGFPRQAVIEAYFACDKNEELAANYLFDGAFDDQGES
ncbi:UV excision repair protein Rad23 [Ganoderma leucocontextum]|nr:UV excision repair protein Rad23 [Ganoderma leucocontextum]KAI1795683.1 UV excision repair protein Rad23 [Ganoderma leucocontextum]